jgi:hypothetical protein
MSCAIKADDRCRAPGIARTWLADLYRHIDHNWMSMPGSMNASPFTETWSWPSSSDASTGARMLLLDCPHPPAGATTLIVSRGIVTRPFHLLAIEVAVVLLMLQTIAIHRMAGMEYPLWCARRTPKSSEHEVA